MRLIYFVAIGLIGLVGRAGVDRENQQTGGDNMSTRPANVLYEGSGLPEPHSKL